jgi:hypothetical protein
MHRQVVFKFRLHLELSLELGEMFQMRSALGQSLHGRPSGKSGHVPYAAESGSKIRSISCFAINQCGLMALPESDSSSQTGAANHALRTPRL